MPLDWAPFVELVRRQQRFLLTTHVRPDPDGLGSILALGVVLEQLGKNVRYVIASLMPPQYQFLDPEKRIEEFVAPGEAWRDANAVVVMDTGTWNQLGPFGPFLRSLSAVKVVIDHHPTQDDLGALPALRLVDTSAEATGRLAYEAITALGAPLSEAVANRLLAAVSTDTGWFRHSNTTAATGFLFGRLMEAGARPDHLYEQLYEQNSLPRLKLRGLVLERLQLTSGGKVAYTEIRRTDYAATGATPQDTEDLVNFTRGIVGVEVGLLFMEQPRGGVKVSFRARRLDVGAVAERFGGGGHRLASGCTIEASLEDARARVLQAVDAALAAR